jgi:hypothetical protein
MRVHSMQGHNDTILQAVLQQVQQGHLAGPCAKHSVVMLMQIVIVWRLLCRLVF